MSNQREHDLMDGVDLTQVRNRNEARVAQCISEELDPHVHDWNEKDIQDIYALALNQLPARYAQRGTIVLREPVRKEDIRDAVLMAMNRVRENPKR